MCGDVLKRKLQNKNSHIQRYILLLHVPITETPMQYTEIFSVVKIKNFQ